MLPVELVSFSFLFISSLSFFSFLFLSFSFLFFSLLLFLFCSFLFSSFLFFSFPFFSFLFFSLLTVGSHVSRELSWRGSCKGIVTTANSRNRFSGGRDGLCWLAGFCLVVDLKCGFVETVAYPMGSALYILCNTLLARNVVCCIFVACCFYTIIILFR